MMKGSVELVRSRFKLNPFTYDHKPKELWDRLPTIPVFCSPDSNWIEHAAHTDKEEADG